MNCRLQRFAWLPLPILLAAFVVFWFTDLPGVFTSPSLLVAFNLVFATPAALLVAGLLGRTFLRRGTAGLLWIGSGGLLWAFAGLLASIATGRDANTAVTLGNTANALAGLCHLIGVVIATRGVSAGSRHRAAWIAGAYGLALAALALVALAAVSGWLPAFFVQGEGGTPVRQMVLLIAFLFFSLAALLLQTEPRSRGSGFARWYGLALWLTAGSFIPLSLQPALGSPLFWTGRAAEFLGGAYLLLAALGARERQAWEISLADALQASEARFRALYEQAPLGIARLDSQTGRFLQVNRRLCEITSRSEAEMLAADFPAITHPDDLAAQLEHMRRLRAGECRSFEMDKRYLRPDGAVVWVTLTVVADGAAGAPPQSHIAMVADITARQRAEAALRTQAEQLEHSRQQALNLMQDAVASRTAAERVAEELELALAGSGGAQWNIALRAGAGDLLPDAMEVSSRLKAIIGFRDDELPSTVSAWQARIHPDDLPRVRASAQAHVAGRTPAHAVEYRVRHKDGSWRWIASRGCLFRDAAGTPVRWAGVDHDISEPKHAEEALRRAEARIGDQYAELDQIYQYAPVGLFCIDRDCRFTRINERMAEINGLSVEAHVGKTLEETVPDLAADLRELYRPIFERGEPVLNVELTGETSRSPGVKRHWLASYFPIQAAAGEVTGLSGAVLEITARKQAEAELSRTKESLETLLETAPVGFCHLDRELRFIRINDRLAEMNGIPASNHLGKTVAEIVPALAPIVQEVTARILATDAPVVGHEFSGETPARPGVTRYWSESWYPVRDAAGVITGFGAIIEEITQRKQMEQSLAAAQARLQEHAATLENLVAQRTAKLTEAVQELEAYSYSIAHDMRAPLRTLQGFSSILLEEYGPRLDTTAHDYLQRIANSAVRLDRLIQDVLTYSRVAKGECPLEPVDPARLIADLLDTYPQLRPDRLCVDIEPPLPMLQANVAALTQVLSNLLTNAVKFVAPGVAPRVRIRAEPAGNGRTRLWFIDNGIGIQAEAHARIFQMFQRLHRNPAYEGTGIGLTIVRKAVERMGGAVGVESTPGEGSRFWIELPCATPDA